MDIHCKHKSSGFDDKEVSSRASVGIKLAPRCNMTIDNSARFDLKEKTSKQSIEHIPDRN